MNDANVSVVSPHLGEIVWQPECELYFPTGLPGFEQCHRIVPIEIPSQRPLVYLQSADNGEVCFLTLPVLAVSPEFILRLSEDDRTLLDLDSAGSADKRSPEIGTDVLCLALLVPSGRTVQTNLDAPIVVNLRNGRSVQTVAADALSSSWRLSQFAGWETLC